MTDDKKIENAELDVCTQASVAEHARPNETSEDVCDDGRAGTKNQQKKEVNAMTDEKKKKEDCQDLVEERKKERQETMDKMSIDSSVAHTYDKNRSENGEKCS